MTQLRQIIKSLNEGITNKKIQNFSLQLAELAKDNKTNSSVLSLIKMAKSLNNYIKARKNKIHNDTLPVLYSIAGHLDLIINSSIQDKAQIRKIFIAEHKKYKTLKSKIKSGSIITKSELDDLRAMILAVEWEITDNTLKNLEDSVSNLLFRLKPKTIVHTFLKIIQATEQHLKNEQGNAQPKSISLLKSVFKDFQTILTTPKMSINQKKKILEANISQYRHFKQRTKQKPRVVAAQKLAQSDAGELPPALSHVSSADMLEDQSSSFTQLPETDDTEAMLPLETIDNNNQAPLSGDQPPQDVMDDLFSVKSSPADDLVDAIHNVSVGDNDPQQALKMLDQGDDQSEDIKTFTPQKKDNEPIPEIDSRLDEFFNLEDPSAQDTFGHSPEELLPTEQSLQAEGKEWATDPVPADEKPVERPAPKLTLDKQPADNSRNIALLKSILTQPDWRSDEKKQKTVSNIVNTLQTEWPDDIEKTKLIEIIRFLVPIDEPFDYDEEEGSISEQSTNQKSGGLFGSVKKLFS